MITLTQIYNEILLKEQNKKMVENKNEDNWKPERCMDYSPPEFCVPVSRAKAAQRRKFSKVLAFIKRVRNIRYGEGCTIMPIPTTSRSMIAIAGSAANVSNLIKFMCAIGLISVECSKYQFNSRYEKCNFSKKYRYYYDNEVKIIDYCEREPIKEFVPKNHPDRKLNDLPMPLISFKSVSFSARLNLVKPSDISAAEFEKCISELLFRKYPDLEKYQMLADEINETYYAQYPELAIRFIPRFTWYKDTLVFIDYAAANSYGGKVRSVATFERNTYLGDSDDDEDDFSTQYEYDYYLLANFVYTFYIVRDGEIKPGNPDFAKVNTEKVAKALMK